MTTLDLPPITKFLSSSSSNSSGGKRDPDGSDLLLSSQTSAPGGGILNNAHEAAAAAFLRNRKLSGGDNGSSSGNGKVTSALKGMFKHSSPGKQIKLDPAAGPLGKTFERQQPIPQEKVKEIKGPEVLSFDPRGQEATAGDGVIITPASPTSPKPAAAAAEVEAGEPIPADNSAAQRQASPEANGGGPSYPEPQPITDGVAPQRRPSAVSNASSAAVSTNGSSLSSGGGTSHNGSAIRSSSGGEGFDSSQSQSGESITSSSTGGSIRFCPLPVSGRLKRANSITIGVAARSHLLQSQGQARQNYVPPMPYYQQQQQQQHLAVPGRQQQQQQQQVVYRRQEDIIDVGELVQKGAIKAWRKMRGRSTRRDSSSPSSDASRSKDAEQDGGGETRPASSGAAAAAVVEEPDEMASEDSNVAERSSSAKADGANGQGTAAASIAAQHAIGGGGGKTPIDGAATPDGTRTPRAGGAGALPGGALASEEAMPHLTRRLSTGTFLKDQSLTQIQETRRRELLGGQQGREEFDGHTPEDAEELQRLKEAHVDLEAQANHHVEPAEQRGWISGLIPNSLSNAAGFGTYSKEEQDATDPTANGEGTDDGASSEASSVSAATEEDEEDDEETREAERLADEAIKNHSGKATKAGGFEKIERSKR